jgi:BON domain
MPDRPPSPDPPDTDLPPEDVQALLGEELPIDQDAVLEPDEIEELRQPTLTERDTGATSDQDRELLVEATEDDLITDVDGLIDDPSEIAALRPDAVSLDELTDEELREGETTDPIEATEEGEIWIPPTDPPVVPVSGDPDGVEVPGFAEIDEAEGSLNAEIREALRSDASTSNLADRLEIAVVGSTAVIRGVVDGIEDSDAIVDVASRVDGIDEVRDEMEVAGL